MSFPKLNDLVLWSLFEDQAERDLTTQTLQLENVKLHARIYAKEDLIVSGSQVVNLVFKSLDPNLEISWHINDGELALKQQSVCSIKGYGKAVLSGERVALNYLGHLSGVASLTRCFVERLRGSKTKILDTRKTTPLMRDLEKKAVVDGGGVNHRPNLADRMMVKENHLILFEDIKHCMERIHSSSSNQSDKPAIIEVKNSSEAKLAIAFGAKYLLLDNMSCEEMRSIVSAAPSDVQFEASGNMTLNRIADVEETGVDFISVGSLTHSAPCADLSLIVEAKTQL